MALWWEDYTECPQCGKEFEAEGTYFETCPYCGCKFTDDTYDDDDYIPEGCVACGGNYPDCADSCPLFD